MKLIKKAAAVLFGALAIAGAAQAQDITVQYNGSVLDFTDAEPAIVEQRVMVPFRSVFEQMGATVYYDVETRTASAEFNGNEIYFSIDEADIYSVDDPYYPIYTMDVPPVFENGRVLVPIRALSEAGGLAVGWDQEESTVNILDPLALVEDVVYSSSSISKLMDLELDGEVPNVYKGKLKMASDELDANIGLDVLTGDKGDVGLVQVNLNADVVVDGDGIKFNLEAIAGDGYDLYLKTDIVDMLAARYPDISDFALAKTVFSSNEWYKVDIEDAISTLVALPTALDYYKKSIEESIAEEIYAAMLHRVDINSAAQCRDIDAIVGRAAAEIDKCLTVDLKGENSADISLAITEDDEELTVSCSIVDGSFASFEFKVTDGDEFIGLSLTAGFEDVDISVPENAIDLDGIIDSLAW